MADLKRRAESLCEKSSLDEDKKLEVQQTAGDAEEQWMMVLEAAEDTHRCCTTFLTVPYLLQKLGRSWLTIGHLNHLCRSFFVTH